MPDEVVEPLIDMVLTMPEEQLFNVSEVFDYEVPPKATESFDSFVCDRCGDMVVETYGRVVGDRKVCIPCQKDLLAER
ncbi:MAG: TraR/DksA C4-type zinc finger protein [Gemmatimonadota bacterium]